MLAVLLIVGGCDRTDAEDHNRPDIRSYHLVADVSWLTEMEADGAVFYDRQGRKGDCMEILQQYGLDAVRLRVWVDPSEHGNWCNASDLLAKAIRAKKLGMDILVDFHYSDWWADPSKQNIPSAWKGHSYPQLKEDIHNHTREVLSLLRSHGILPKWIQIGNETSNGFLWPVGKATEHPDQYAGLFKAGYDAAKIIFPNASVLVHLDSGHNPGLYRWNLDILKKGGARWDMIGMSVYPFWAQQGHPELTADKVIDLSVDNMKALVKAYHCDIMVVETGMECARNGKLLDRPALLESKRQLSRLLDACLTTSGTQCKGVFYWEPECKPSRYALGAFSESGRPTVIMDAFKEMEEQ